METINDRDSIVVAAVFDNAPQAHIVTGYLESHGIHAAIDNEIVTTLMPFLSPGYRVLVNSDNLDEARRLIAEMKLD